MPTKHIKLDVLLRSMYLKGYRVSYPVRGLWSSGTGHKYFMYEDKAKEFYKTANADAWKNNECVRIEEVAYIVIEGKPYCIGTPVDVLDIDRFFPDKSI
jgi:hypothetical protein